MAGVIFSAMAAPNVRLAHEAPLQIAPRKQQADREHEEVDLPVQQVVLNGPGRAEHHDREASAISAWGRPRRSVQVHGQRQRADQRAGRQHVPQRGAHRIRQPRERREHDTEEEGVDEGKRRGVVYGFSPATDAREASR